MSLKERVYTEKYGISPVIGVVLFVAIVVVLVGIVGFFVVELNGDTKDTSRSGVSTDQSQESYNVQVVDSGNSDTVAIQVNGVEVATTESNAGSAIEVTEKTQLCRDDRVSVISGSSGSETVLKTDTVEQDINCSIKNTTTKSTATYDGSSWIVETFLQNNGESEKYYVVTLSNGNNQQVTDTVTLQSGESTTLETTNSTYSKDDPITVGVLSPDESSTEYTLANRSTNQSSTDLTGWSGGDSAGSYYYNPTGTSGTTVNSIDYQSGFTSSSDESSDPSLSLSSTRVQTGDSIELFAEMKTTKSPEANETLIAYATETNTSSNRVIESSYTIQENSSKTVSPSFSISQAGQYIITATLKGSGKVYEVGTVNVISYSDTTISGTNLSSSSVEIGKQVTYSADLTNNTSSSKTVTAKLYRDDKETFNQEVTISANSTKTISRTFSTSQSGRYKFYVGVVESSTFQEIGEVTVTDPNCTSNCVTTTTEISNDNVTVNSYTYLTSNTSSGSNSVSVNDESSFSSGEKVLIIQMQENNGGTAGTYEYNTIDSTSSGTVQFEQSLSNEYYSGSTDTVTQLVSVATYDKLVISGSVTAPVWNGKTGGLVVIETTDVVEIQSGASINVSAKGFRGGDGVSGAGTGYQGESYLGRGTKSHSANGGAGGGGGDSYDNAAGGAGGGFGAQGEDDTPGIGGNAYNNADSIFLGSGGGGGDGERDDCGTVTGGFGGPGGGSVVIDAKDLTVNGQITANGGDGTEATPYSPGAYCRGDTGGGGGSGGEVFITTDSGFSSTSSISIQGGISPRPTTGNDDGKGGKGVIEFGN